MDEIEYETELTFANVSGIKNKSNRSDLTSHLFTVKKIRSST